MDEITDKVLVEPDTAKRDLLIKEAFEIAAKDFGYIPLHQQALAWGVSKKVKLAQRADNQVLLYWATKQDVGRPQRPGPGGFSASGTFRFRRTVTSATRQREK